MLIDRPLTITLWDFSWYTRTGPGEPFEDLERACSEAVERGYDTVRMCAMPFLLFGSGLPTDALQLGPLGGGHGSRTRWYDVGGWTTIDARAQLLDLLRACRDAGLRIILSSWEYQQSPSFSADRAWLDALLAVPPEERAERLADCLADLLDLVEGEGLLEQVALTELHNEVQIGKLTEGLAVDRSDHDAVTRALLPRLQRGIDRFRARRPEDPVTVNYAGVPIGALSAVPDGVDALVVHPYVYGVLGELIETFGLRGDPANLREDQLRALLRPDAPAPGEWWPTGERSWTGEATVMNPAELYVHDWCDPTKVDAWLLDRWGMWRHETHTRLALWLDAAADAARSRGIPLLLGEGWFGYTPRDCTFEEGPVGSELCEHAMREAARVGAAGTVVCSNAAPHHPMWADIDLQQRCTRLFHEEGERRHARAV
ncbi:MAG: cellulase-like family protein [Brachybacterium sp.]|nr:cellulase-like family protein [Brachybacterium sp.]